MLQSLDRENFFDFVVIHGCFLIMFLVNEQCKLSNVEMFYHKWSSALTNTKDFFSKNLY